MVLLLKPILKPRLFLFCRCCIVNNGLCGWLIKCCFFWLEYVQNVH
jgi:hypothetical protein